MCKSDFRAIFLVMKFLGKAFQEFLFEPDVVNAIGPGDWWKTHFNKKDVDEQKTTS